MLRIVKKNKRFYSILIILLLLSLSATAQEEYAVPAVPDTITTVTARADYAVSHYWERYDFSNAQLLQREGYTEQALSNFIALLGYASAQVQQQAVNQWLTSAAANQETFCFMVDMADKYLNDQESPLHNDHLYLLVARHIIDSSAANDAQRQRAQFMVNLLTGNAVGTIAPDFSFRDMEGHEYKSQTSNLKSQILLVFLDPDCERCQDLLFRLRHSSALHTAETKGQLTTAFVNVTESPEAEQHYDLRQLPKMYLLDAERRIILRDCDYYQLMEQLSKNQ